LGVNYSVKSITFAANTLSVMKPWRLITTLAMWLVTIGIAAQTLTEVPVMKHASADAPAKKQQPSIAPPQAWRVSEPLGQHYPSTIDTLFEDYHRSVVPSMVSTAWATTGNYGAPSQNQVFFERPSMSEFFFEDAISWWAPSVAHMRYYNTRIPMTLLSYTFGGNKNSNQDRTQLLFSGNAGRKTAIGGGFDYMYSKGSYDVQANKDFTWQLFGSHIGDRYEVQTFFNHYNYTNKESGGITDDRYITDPAEVQGGDTRVDNKSIPTRLTDAHSHLEGSQLYLNQRYKVGYYRYRRDSVTDTVIDRTYVPVTSFIWTLDFKHAKHQFLNTYGSEDTAFFKRTYLTLDGTNEATKYWRLRNTLGISLLEGFNRWAKAGVALYLTHEVRRYTQVTDSVSTLDTVPAGLDAIPYAITHATTQNLLWVGGQLTKQRGALLRYNVSAQFGLLGDAVGEVDVHGDVSVRVKIKNDTASLRGYGYIKNQAVPYLINNYVSNHFVWQNHFDKTQRIRLGGQLDIPHTGTNVDVGYETLNRYIYWSTDGLPVQTSGAVHVLSAQLRQHLHFKALHWENSLVLQTSSDDQVLPLPKLAIYSNVYAKFVIARVLHVQLGVDGNYYTAYYAPAYNPATMSYYNQRDVKCGDFPFLNLYANFKMKQARFFVAWTHFNQMLTSGTAYFATPHYPLNPARFQLGVSVNFVN